MPKAEGENHAARVLVVDDEEPVRRLLASGLSSLGYDVRTASDGGEALRVLSEESVDVVVLDLNMAPVNGWEVVEYLHGTSLQVVTILLSAHVDVPATVTALRAGVFDVLQKPVRLAELRTRIDEGLSLRLNLSVPPEQRDRAGLPYVGRIAARRPDSTAKAWGTDRLLGDSDDMENVRQQIRSIARFGQVSTLIIGETGTGKELVAQAVHDLSIPDEPFVSINCAAIPEQLFESELFGYEAGAFTGAKGSKPGLFEAAGRGTVFLDEVGEMPLALQPKLLRVLQNRSFRRVGGSDDMQLKARIVSATNRRLSAERQEGMRSDLYFRLAGFTIVVPPLRRHLEDVDVLAEGFLCEFSRSYPGLPTRISDDAMTLLKTYNWPGNVRELRRVVEQAAVLASGGVLEREAIRRALAERGANLADAGGEEGPKASSQPEIDSMGLNELQQQLILDAFNKNEQNLSRTARQLQIPRTTLRDRLKRYGVL